MYWIFDFVFVTYFWQLATLVAAGVCSPAASAVAAYGDILRGFGFERYQFDAIIVRGLAGFGGLPVAVSDSCRSNTPVIGLMRRTLAINWQK